MKLAEKPATRPPPTLSARRAGLRYTTDHAPGLSRKRAGKTFYYFRADGRRVSDRATLDRVARLAIPPAWTEVWICADAAGHLQATGRDARGRKQSRYHADFRAARDSSKYERVIAFAEALPSIRRTVTRHLRLGGLPREKVMAAVVALLERTLIRIGNDRYARDHEHFGLTTMHDEHVRVRGRRVAFRFTGKSGVAHEIDLDDARLARIVKACQDLPGQELFAYLDERGKQHDVKSNDVNAYLREITGRDFTAKDFRTWAGTVLASRALAAFDAFGSQRQAKKNVVAAIEQVAKKLGNTRSVCRKCYVHPAILDGYLDGSLSDRLRARVEPAMRRVASHERLTDEEAKVVAVIRDSLKPRRAARRAA